MKAFILVFSFFAGVYGCLDSPPSCSCPSILNITTMDKPTQLEHDGCDFNMNCSGDQFYTVAFGLFNMSTVPVPANVTEPYFGIYVTDENNATDVPRVNVRESLGIVCENGSWFATKFPAGLYYVEYGDLKSIPANEMNGKGFKGQIISMNWFVLGS